MLGCILFTKFLTDMTTSVGSFIRTWSYLVNETVTFDRRKAASAWWNQVCGSAGQNSGSYTATALTLTVGGAGRREQAYRLALPGLLVVCAAV